MIRDEINIFFEKNINKKIKVKFDKNTKQDKMWKDEIKKLKKRFKTNIKP